MCVWPVLLPLLCLHASVKPPPPLQLSASNGSAATSVPGSRTTPKNACCCLLRSIPYLHLSHGRPPRGSPPCLQVLAVQLYPESICTAALPLVGYQTTRKKSSEVDMSDWDDSFSGDISKSLPRSPCRRWQVHQRLRQFWRR